MMRTPLRWVLRSGGCRIRSIRVKPAPPHNPAPGEGAPTHARRIRAVPTVVALSARPPVLEGFAQPALPIANSLEIGFPHTRKKRIPANALPRCEGRPKQHDASPGAQRGNIHDAAFTHLPEEEVDQPMADRLPFRHDSTCNAIGELDAPIIFGKNGGGNGQDLSPRNIERVRASLANANLPSGGISEAVCESLVTLGPVVATGSGRTHGGHHDSDDEPSQSCQAMSEGIPMYGSAQHVPPGASRTMSPRATGPPRFPRRLGEMRSPEEVIIIAHPHEATS